MHIDTFVLGDFETNCYCLRADKSRQDCILIDPGLHPYPVVQYLEKENLAPVAIVITHGHIDHIGGVEIIRELYPDSKVYIHKADAAMLTSPAGNLSMVAGTVFQARPAEEILENHLEIRIAGLRFEVLHTPGHTPGGICLYCPSEGVVFVGDTIFAGSVGRTDFPGGSHQQLIDSIRNHLLNLPETTKLYPGHGPATTIRNEKKHNPYLT
jgi:glyoxylase-like metal-dependent hydrolase (beta-lactamase superfamily II)